MANPFVRCLPCGGNMWPGGQKEHAHFNHETNPWPLKLKLRVGQRGWSRAANPRTNSPSNRPKTLLARKRAYGPW